MKDFRAIGLFVQSVNISKILRPLSNLLGHPLFPGIRGLDCGFAQRKAYVKIIPKNFSKCLITTIYIRRGINIVPVLMPYLVSKKFNIFLLKMPFINITSLTQCPPYTHGKGAMIRYISVYNVSVIFINTQARKNIIKLCTTDGCNPS